jgi:hypothetical protein
MDDCPDFLTVQVWVLVPNARNEIGPNHAKFPLGRDLAGIGTAHLGLFLMAGLWPIPEGNPVDAESWCNAQIPSRMAARQITTMATVIAPAATNGNQSLRMSQPGSG